MPLANFTNNKSTKDGLDRYCKECKAKARKKWHSQTDETVIREVADKVTDKLEHSAVEEPKLLQDPNSILNAIKDVMKGTLEIKEQRVRDMLDDTVQSLLGIAIQLSDARKTLKNVYYEEFSKKENVEFYGKHIKAQAALEESIRYVCGLIGTDISDKCLEV